jgi:hypothetical protein
MTHSNPSDAAAAFVALPLPALVLDAARREVLAASCAARDTWGPRPEWLGAPGARESLDGAREGDELWLPIAEGGVDRWWRAQTVRLGVEPDAPWLVLFLPPAAPADDIRREQGRVALAGELARAVAHDFRNVLQAVAILREDAGAVDADALAVSLQSIERALGLGSDLLGTLGTLGVRPAGVRPRDFDATVALGSCVGLLRVLCRSCGGIRVQVPTDPVMVLGDPGAFAHLVLRLCIAGRDLLVHGREGALFLRAWAADGSLHVNVGIGGPAGDEAVHSWLSSGVEQLARNVGGTLAIGAGAEVELAIPLRRPVAVGRTVLVVGECPPWLALLERTATRLGAAVRLTQELPAAMDPTSVACVVDLDDPPGGVVATTRLSAGLTAHLRWGVPLVAVASRPEGTLRAQLELATACGASWLRPPLSVSDLAGVLSGARLPGVRGAAQRAP